MSTEVKHRRGSTAQCDAMTPAEGEIIVDTTLKQTRVGDGTTLGGNKHVMSNATMDALRSFDTNGFVAQTATATFAGRSFADNDGIIWTNPAGVAGNPTPNISAVKSLWVPASLMRPLPSGGCAALVDNAMGSFYNAPSLDFDATADEAAAFLLALPNGWDKSTIQGRVYWSHASTTTNFGVRWVLSAKANSDNEAMDDNAIAQGAVNDTGGTTNRLYITGKANLTIGSPVADDLLLIQVLRNGSNVNDTLAIDARLHGVMLYHTINTLVDT